MAEHAEPRCVERESATGVGSQVDPSDSQDTQHVGVTEDEDVAVALAQPVDHGVGTPSHVSGRLAGRAPVGPHRPSGPLGADIGRRSPLVVAVVPLHQAIHSLGVRSETGNRTRVRGAR